MPSLGKKFRGRGRKTEIILSKKLRHRAREREKRLPPVDASAIARTTQALAPPPR